MESFWFETDVDSRHKVALKFDHISLQSWGLSNRTLNALLSYDFKMTVGDVIRAGETLRVKGLGDAGLEELKTKASQLLMEAHNIKAQLSTDQSNVRSNSETPEDPLLKILPQSAQSVPLDHLHLDVKTNSALVKAGIATTGDLYTISNSRLGEIQGLHPHSLGNVNNSLISFLNSLNHEGEVDWFQYWKAREIQILPPASTSSTSQEQVIREIPKIIEEILRREPDKRLWTIIQRRFGLGETKYNHETFLALEPITVRIFPWPVYIISKNIL